MSLNEAQAAESSNDQAARIIPFPRGAFETIDPRNGPIGEQAQERAAFPTSKQFLATMRESGVSSETTGAQVMMLLYESLDLIPRKSELDSLVQLLAQLRQLGAEYHSLQANDIKGVRLTSFKSKLKSKNLSLSDLDTAMVVELEQKLAKLRDERAPLQDLTDTVERNYANFLDHNDDGKPGGFSDKIAAIYEATDDFVEGDELLELAQSVRKTAMLTPDNGLAVAARAFERFTRFMIFDDNRTAAKFEDQTNRTSRDT